MTPIIWHEIKKDVGIFDIKVISWRAAIWIIYGRGGLNYTQDGSKLWEGALGGSLYANTAT